MLLDVIDQLAGGVRLRQVHPHPQGPTTTVDDHLHQAPRGFV